MARPLYTFNQIYLKCLLHWSFHSSAQQSLKELLHQNRSEISCFLHASYVLTPSTVIVVSNVKCWGKMYRVVSKFMNITTQGFDLLWWLILTSVFRPFITSSNESDETTIQLLCRALSPQSRCVFHCVSLIAFMLYAVRLAFSHLMFVMLLKSVFILLQLNFNAFCVFFRLFHISLLAFCMFLEPSRHFTLMVNTDVCDSLICASLSKTLRLYSTLISPINCHWKYSLRHSLYVSVLMCFRQHPGTGSCQHNNKGMCSIKVANLFTLWLADS